MKSLKNQKEVFETIKRINGLEKRRLAIFPFYTPSKAIKSKVHVNLKITEKVSLWTNDWSHYINIHVGNNEIATIYDDFTKKECILKPDFIKLTGTMYILTYGSEA